MAIFLTNQWNRLLFCCFWFHLISESKLWNQMKSKTPHVTKKIEIHSAIWYFSKIVRRIDVTRAFLTKGYIYPPQRYYANVGFEKPLYLLNLSSWFWFQNDFRRWCFWFHIWFVRKIAMRTYSKFQFQSGRRNLKISRTYVHFKFWPVGNWNVVRT